MAAAFLLAVSTAATRAEPAKPSVAALPAPAALVSSPAASAPPGYPWNVPPGEAVDFAALPNFAADDHAAALRVFRTSCKALAARTLSGRAALPAPVPLTATCDLAAAVGAGESTARAFFEASFTPRRIVGEQGAAMQGLPAAGASSQGTAFFTGYYEPVVDGSVTRTEAFATPLYGRPADLVDIAAGSVGGLDPALTAARRSADGRLVPMPDRAAIEAGALGTQTPPLIWLREPADAFFVAVQGSARIRLPDSSLRRLVYAGRNGYPYTAIGKLLAETLHVPPASMGMEPLRAWIVTNGQRPDEGGGRLMQRNRSYIFFAIDDALPADAGPIGGEGVSLTPGRSLAVDRGLWPYGLPFYLDAVVPSEAGEPAPLRRLMVGQDTGSAILGPARGDIFFGTGPAAGRRAGATRAHGTLFVLWPKDASQLAGAATGQPVPRTDQAAGGE